MKIERVLQGVRTGEVHVSRVPIIVSSGSWHIQNGVQTGKGLEEFE